MSIERFVILIHIDETKFILCDIKGPIQEEKTP